MNFKSWKELNKKNEEGLGLYCKAQLKKMGLKPKKDSIPEIHKVFFNFTWKEYEFYKLEQTTKIKKYLKTSKECLPITPTNLCKSLYTINKSAKKSRDSKKINYYEKNYGITNRCKKRENKLYDLKNRVINKMIDEEILVAQGYHIQNINDTIYLIYYKFDDYGFHVIADKELINIKKLNFLGEINLISSEKIKKNSINYFQAIQILEKYIED